MADKPRSDASIPTHRYPGVAPGGSNGRAALQLQGVRTGCRPDESGRLLPDAGQCRIPLGGHGERSVSLRRQFRAYTKEQGLPSVHIKALHQTADGEIWAGTSLGLARLKGEVFETVRSGPGNGAHAI